MKVFFMSTHANQGTGYGRVANKITNHLVEQGHDVTFFAFQNYPGQAIGDRFIDPRIKFIDGYREDPDSPKGFGDKVIKRHFDAENPDVLFLYNDLSVCVSVIRLIDPGCRVVCYLDIVYPWEDVERFEFLKSRCDFCYTFLNCWREHLVGDLGWDPRKVGVLYHGIDTDRFKHAPGAKGLLGFDDDDFVVLNMNRNSYRKQWCVTIKAFMKFLQMNNCNPKIKLFCGCMPKTEDGFDLLELIKVECMKLDLDYDTIVNGHIFSTPKPLHATDEYVNLVYNACDVGMNTCCGEGFGLTALEHGLLGKPQIVTGVPALRETMRDFAHFVEPRVWTTVSKYESHGGEVAICEADDFATELNRVYKGKDVHRTLDPTHFEWESVLKNLVL
jgi:glycosyltransferase involved in cell wall biosynthesis